MKTPREILFARHENVGPKLDAIRREMVTEFKHQDTKAQSFHFNFVSWCLGGFQKIGRELIFPCRRIWSGLAAIWILIFIVNFSQRDKSGFPAQKNLAPQMILTFRQQEKWLTELSGPTEAQTEMPAAEPSKIVSPQPRSERRLETLAG